MVQDPGYDPGPFDLQVISSKCEYEEGILKYYSCCHTLCDSKDGAFNFRNEILVVSGKGRSR